VNEKYYSRGFSKCQDFFEKKSRGKRTKEQRQGKSIKIMKKIGKAPCGFSNFYI
jgi:hypothetical protein